MKNIYIYLGICISVLLSSCGKDFLTVRPIEDLTGNNFWQSKNDVDMYLRGLYADLRTQTTSCIFFPGTGDFRLAPINRNAGSNATGQHMNHLSYLRSNSLDGLFNQYRGSTRDWAPTNDPFGFHVIRNWRGFYNIIAKANIAVYEIDRMESGLTEQQKSESIADAKFMRNLCYFFLVRLFGDVPYYTEAYHSKAIGRTNMLEVLANVSSDLESFYKELPWTYDDPLLVGTKANRGAAIALLMHVNMWRAGFSTESKNSYYEKVVAFGQEIMEQNGGAYALLPLKDTKEIFKGRSKEGLFEIVQNFNYGELFFIGATYADNVIRAPWKPSVPNSYIHYDPKFIKNMYPEDAADGRKTTWFQEDIYATNNRFVMLKYVNIFVEEGEDANPDDNQIVFRYVDPILMRAEALAELGRDAEARSIVNIVRTRAEASMIESSGDDLKDDIWWERVRELLGEGHFFYDLVRTKKALNDKYTHNPIPLAAFNAGAWTWPIDRQALVNNPYMTLNTYWNN